MIQRQISHEAGTFPLCRKCSREPKHYLVTGRSTKDSFNLRIPPGERHLIECFCSGAECSTRLLPSFAAALIEWRDQFAIAPIAVGRRRRAA